MPPRNALHHLLRVAAAATLAAQHLQCTQALRLQPASPRAAAAAAGSRRAAAPPSPPRPVSGIPAAPRPLRAALLGCAVLGQSVLFAAGWAPPAQAFGSDSKKVGEIPASGLIFKDTLDVTAFSDPKVSGVHLYISDFSKPITDRLKGDFFSDPSTASITCVRDGTVSLADDVEKGVQGEEVFSEAKSLVFKSVKVRRIVDTANQNVVYVSYSQKVMSNDDNNKSRFKSSLCAVHIDPAPPAPAAAAAGGK